MYYSIICPLSYNYKEEIITKMWIFTVVYFGRSGVYLYVYMINTMLLGTSVLRHYYHDYYCTRWLYDICTSPARCLISWLLFTVLFYGYYLLAFSVALQLARELGFSMLEAVCVFVVGRDEGGFSQSAQSVLTYRAFWFFRLRFCMKRTYFNWV